MQNLDHNGDKAYELLIALVSLLCVGSAIILVTLALRNLNHPAAGILLIVGGVMVFASLWPLSMIDLPPLRDIITGKNSSAKQVGLNVLKPMTTGVTTMISSALTYLENNWVTALMLSILSGIITAPIVAYTIYIFWVLPKQITIWQILFTSVLVILTNTLWTAFQHGRPRTIS